MAEAGDKGIPLGDYIKFHVPEPFARAQLDRGELRYKWRDINNNERASDDGGPLPPKGWWLRPIFTEIDCERSSVRGNAQFAPHFPPMFLVKVFPVVAVEHPAQKAPRPGRPSSAQLVLEEAERRLRSSDKALLVRQGRPNFLAGLSGWLRNTHPEARRMADKTIGDRLRKNANVRALLPETWLRRK